MLDDNLMFGLELAAGMAAHTASITDSIIEDYKKQVAQLEKENDLLRSELRGIRNRLAWIGGTESLWPEKEQKQW